MECIGDKIAGFDTTQKCYMLEACVGCDKCIIKCEGCENCNKEETLRTPEPGDFIVVQTPILKADYKGPKWVPAMDLAIGRTAWVAKGNPTEGFTLKFVTTKKEILDQFVYPLEALRLALPPDKTIDKMIRTAKEGSPNEEM